MATRENQGLQIALILFVMITVALAISTYIYFRKSEEMIAAAVASRTAEQQANARRDQVIDENLQLKTFIGWPMETSVADIATAFNADMTQFGADYPADEPKNYRTLPNYLLGAVRQVQGLVADASVREKELEARILQIEQREIAKTEEALKGQQVAIDDRDTVRTAFDGDRKKFVDDTEKLKAQIAEKNTQITTITNVAATEKKSVEDNLAAERQRADALRDRLAGLTKTTFEAADGRITWVNQGSGKVWISVGLLDGVRPQTSFKVYPPDRNSYEVENSKGTIEVLSIIDKHLAEARIIDDSLSDPILPGDVIFTPLWQPGTNVRFALAGMIDLDDDGRSDRSLIRSLISMNSGIVDAEVDDTGKRSGKMTVDTRYLVVGKRPTETTDPAAIAGYTNMLTEAQNLGIEQITVDKLLNYLNYRGTERSVKLGPGANAADFKAQPEDGVNRRSTGRSAFDNEFQPRRPPQPTEKGAF